jgi:hypothetical protein
MEEMARALSQSAEDEEAEQAYRFLLETDPGQLRAKVEGAKTSWLLAWPAATLRGAYPPARPPEQFSILATDGSFISPDRHIPARFLIINIGYAALTYGPQPDAYLDSKAHFYFGEEELRIPHPFRHIFLEQEFLGAKRTGLELEALMEALDKAKRPAVGLQDGSLILWGLPTSEDRDDISVRDYFLRPFLSALGKLRDRGVPVASYLSLPQSRDVVNSLRVQICEDQPVNCDHCSHLAQRQPPICDSLAGLLDRQLFRFLKPGERSDLFRGSSKILSVAYGEHWIYFFYLNVGGEIVRLEVPQWVAQDEERLSLLHTLVYNQCQRGRGYPSALQEAHEQAVITTSERQTVDSLVEEALAREGIVLTRSGKATSKRERGV